MDLEADVQIGDFKIVRRLGAGGMGVVYLARQVSLNRLVALKVLGPALNRDADKSRFQREAQAVAMLSHPSIAHVHFVGQDRHVCYIAMEYIDGISLREVIDRLAAADDPALTIDSVLDMKSTEAEGTREERFDRPTEVYTRDPASDGKRVGQGGLTEQAEIVISSSAFIRRCCEIVRDASFALAHAHDMGVVHRDIKPDNLLLDKQGRIHLIDFGIARFYEDETLTNTGALVGTPMYMSPEQVTGRLKVDHRTDIYSLGVTLYELMSLRRPILAQTREGVLRQIVTKDLLPLSWRNRMISRDLEAVVHQATAKDPDSRYQSTRRLAADLDCVLGGIPVSAKPHHYNRDEREIAAERPRGIIYAAFTFFFFGILMVSFGVAFLLSEISIGTSRILGAVCGATGIGVVATGSGLLSGKKWAIKSSTGILWTAFASLIINYLFFQQNTRFNSPFDSNENNLYSYIDRNRWHLLLIVLSSMIFIFTNVVLLLTSTLSWVALAERLRREHSEHVSQYTKR